MHTWIHTREEGETYRNGLNISKDSWGLFFNPHWRFAIRLRKRKGRWPSFELFWDSQKVLKFRYEPLTGELVGLNNKYRIKEDHWDLEHTFSLYNRWHRVNHAGL